MFEYEKLLYDSLLIPDFYNPSKHTFKHKHLWVKKATVLGSSGSDSMMTSDHYIGFYQLLAFLR